MLKKEYKVCLPTMQGTVEEECRQCIDRIAKSIPSEQKIVKLNIFVDLPDYQTLTRSRMEISGLIANTFDEIRPAYNIVVQPPEKPWKVTVEALTVTPLSGSLITRFLGEIPYVVMDSDDSKEIWAAGLDTGLFPDDTRKAAESGFDKVKSILESENMSLNNIVRQWNYIGNILSIKNGYQNYQVFNEVRSEYYGLYRNVKMFPAATGVGMKYGGVALDFHAVRSDKKISFFPVDNPAQINAYCYGQNVLRGNPRNGNAMKNPPQFERALFMHSDVNPVLYVSGTASILGQKTVGLNDVSRQTEVTIGNINKLADYNRIRSISGKNNITGLECSFIRVYVKNPGDFQTVRSICDSNFPSVPSVFIEADICRDDLLVEIEAEYNVKME
jgi:hypothetical protein